MVPRAPRLELMLKVEYDSAGQFRSDYLTNLSSGGLYLRTDLVLSVGGTLKLTISMPSGSLSIPVEAVVRWVNQGSSSAPRGAGVEFINLDPSVRQKIEQLLSTVEAITAGAHPEPARSAQPPAQSADDALRLRVVLLETNENFGEILRYQMTRFAEGRGNGRVWNLELVTANDGKSCLSALFQKPSDVAILDFDRAKAEPAALVNSIRSHKGYERLPVIILSGPVPALQRERHVMFLTKPFAMQPLFTTIQTLLTTSRTSAG